MMSPPSILKAIAVLQLLLSASLIYAHGGAEHAHGEPETADQRYAQRHMASEHHIDTFDPKSFFQLHDLNGDGILDREEIEAIYGVHHVYSQKKSKDEQAHQDKADHVVHVVLDIFDKNKDGRISPDEFVATGLDALPNFDDLGAEGHHYDVESEFFLHHEEEFHNTPETQTDEAYVHPEDIEHFAHHERIEREEYIREAKYQGVSVDEVIAEHEHVAEAVPPPEQQVTLGNEHDGIPDAAAPAADYQPPQHPHNDQVQADAPVQPPPQPASPSGPKITRQPPPEKLDPAARFRKAKDEGKVNEEWGAGDSGYKVPKTPGERMRKNVPYKYKFRRSWGDF